MTTLRPTQLYDVAVIGNALPGLVAAALLAQRGHRVLHVAESVEGSWESDGWRLPMAPQLLPSPRLLPAVRATLDELTLAPFVHRALQAVPLQILQPRARFELGSEADRRRAFGPEAEGIAGALARLAALVEETAPAMSGPLLPRTFGERLRRWRHGRAHRSVFEMPLALDGAAPIEDALRALHRFAASDAGEPGGFAFARATAPLLHGVHRLPDGGIAAHLVGHVRARRGDALLARVEELELERGRFAGLRIRGDLWRARTLIAALPVQRLAALVPHERHRRRLEAFGAPVESRPVHLRSLVLASEGVPPGLGPLALATGFGTTALLQLGPAARIDGRDDPSARTLTIASLADGEALDALLEEILPFHERHLRHRAVPPEPQALWVVRGAGPGQFGGLPIRTPLSGVLHAGPELLPGLGMEGAFVAGRAVAAEAEARAGRGKAR